MKKVCKQCNQEFEITDDDLAFYKKISPIFDGKTFEIPPPTLCPDCRQIRRQIWRNEKNLHKRKCDLCHKEIISIYPEDSSCLVYCQSCWWSDKWSPESFAVEYDQGSFFEKMKQLYGKVPRIGTLVTNCENSEYNIYLFDSKDCYMLVSSVSSENCMFGRKVANCKDVIDSHYPLDCENSYEVVFSKNCYNCSHVTYCQDCSDSRYLLDCKGCHNCFMCSNLVNKSFYIRNKAHTKEDYEKIIDSLWTGSYKDNVSFKDEYFRMMKSSIRRENENTKCENCRGNDLMNCKNCKDCYEIRNAENAKFHYDTTGAPIANCMDCDIASSELVYEGTGILAAYTCLFSIENHHTRNTYYCIDCFDSSHDLFGCVGMKKNEYCILNKKYSKEKYDNKVAEIIKEMKKNGEWGEFFPMSLSPFSYNETLANDFYPKNKDEAENLGSQWNDEKNELKFDKDPIDLEDDIEIYKNDDEREKLLLGVIKCIKSGRLYRITPQELAFYIANKIPIPRKHYLERFKDRLSLRNPRKLYHRQCMCEESDHDHSDRCTNEYETTYAPERPEKVYCEKCYQKSVI